MTERMTASQKISRLCIGLLHDCIVISGKLWYISNVKIARAGNCGKELFYYLKN